MPPQKIDPLWSALSKLRRGKLEECITICNEILANSPGDQVHSTIMLCSIFNMMSIKNLLSNCEFSLGF